MTARLQRDVQIISDGLLAGLCNRIHFSVGFTETPVISSGNDIAIRSCHNSTDHRIRFDGSFAICALLQSELHQ